MKGKVYSRILASHLYGEDFYIQLQKGGHYKSVYESVDEHSTVSPVFIDPKVFHQVCDLGIFFRWVLSLCGSSPLWLLLCALELYRLWHHLQIQGNTPVYDRIFLARRKNSLILIVLSYASDLYGLSCAIFNWCFVCSLSHMFHKCTSSPMWHFIWTFNALLVR